MSYELSRKALLGIGWRWGISFNGKLMIHDSSYYRLKPLLDKLVEREATFVPSVAFRERLRVPHLERVREAQRMTS